MSRVKTPDNINIASLKKKQAERVDPMTPGVGTPWEDRGTHGVVGAFFKTCKMSLTSPGQLMMAVRRPETTSDATAFVIGCCIPWGICAFIHGLIWLKVVEKNHPTFEIDTTWYYIYCAIGGVAVAGGTYLLFLLYNLIYRKLIAQEKTQSPLAPALLYNVNAYALGPSVLAVIPLLGPVLALVLILVDLIVAGSKRLGVRTGAAVVDAVLGFVIVVVVGFLGYFIGSYALDYIVGDVITPPPPPRVSSSQ